MASKTKRITHNNIHLSFLSFVEREIQFRINVFIICYMIDGWKFRISSKEWKK
jgi:hypothetical protein